MADTLNTFDGGTNAATITTGNSGGASGDAWSFVSIGSGGSATYFSASAYRGGMSGQFISGTAGAITYAEKTVGSSSGSLYARVRFRMPTLPDATGMRPVVFAESTGAFQVDVRLINTGVVQLRTGTGSTVGSSTKTFQAGEWVDIGVAVLVFSATVGQLELKVYDAAGNVLQTITSAANLDTLRSGGANKIQVGAVRSGVNSFTVQIDDVATSTTGYPSTLRAAGIAELGTTAHTTGNTATITTASFTPADSSLLVAYCAMGNGAATASSLGAVTDSLGGTWTRLAGEASATGGDAEVWARDVATGASMTVTWNPGGSGASGLAMIVKWYDGAKPVAQQPGATAVNSGGTAYSRAITTTATGSLVAGALGRASDAVTVTANASTTLLGQINGTSGDTAATFRSRLLTYATGAVTLGFSNAAAGANRMALAEILPVVPSANVSLDGDVADAVTLADSVTVRLVTAARAATDSVTVADSATRTSTRARTASDAVTVADAVARGAAGSRGVADQVTVTDTAGRLVAGSRATADTVTVADSVTRARLLPVSATDAVTVADSAVRASTRARAVADTVTAADAVTKLIAVTVYGTDTVGVADTAGPAGTFSRTITDSINAADAAVGAAGQGRSAADSVAVADAVARTRAGPRALTDAVVVADTVARTAARARTGADTLGVVDAVAAGRLVQRAVTDLLHVADSVAGFQSAGVLVADAVTVTDSVARTTARSRAVTDLLHLADAAARATALRVSPADGVTLAELLAAGRLTVAAAVDTITAVAVTAGAVGRAVTAADQVGVTDQVGVGRLATRSVADLLALADAIVLGRALLRQVDEQATAADLTAAVVQLSVAVADDVTVLDAATGSTYTPPGPVPGDHQVRETGPVSTVREAGPVSTVTAGVTAGRVTFTSPASTARRTA